jgi:DNA uptake protein ComE-like DNA-binding protein
MRANIPPVAEGVNMLSSPLFSSVSALFIGANCGYEFGADQVRLNADIRVDTPAAQPVNLQLWACPAAFTGGLLQGIKVAEIDCGVLSQDTTIDQTVPAYLPAGTQAHVMELVLVENDVILSHVSFSQPQCFVLPRLQGEVKLAGDASAATVSVETIENPRTEDNTSGTLVLELWSLPTEYTGGAFAGTQLASAILGVLAGQSSWQNTRVELPLVTASALGEQLVLMLREWTVSGYLTRDYRHVQLAEEVLPPVAAVVPTEQVEAKADVAPEPEAVAESAAKPESKPAPAPAVAAKAVAPSLNSATFAQLTAGKMVSKAIAEKLLASRPYKSWQEVGKIKGVGDKVLAKLRAVFSL